MSAGACPAISLPAAAPRVLDEAQDDLLSLRSRDPLRVRDPASPAFLDKEKSVAIFAARWQLVWRHDIRHNDIQLSDTQHNSIERQVPLC